MTRLDVIDRNAALEMAGGSAELADELFGMLIAELPNHQEKIEAALAAGDLGALQAHIHKLNGSATYCGVPALKAAADLAETNLKQGRTEAIAQEVQAIVEEIDRVLEFSQDTA